MWDSGIPALSGKNDWPRFSPRLSRRERKARPTESHPSRLSRVRSDSGGFLIHLDRLLNGGTNGQTSSLERTLSSSWFGVLFLSRQYIISTAAATIRNSEDREGTGEIEGEFGIRDLAQARCKT